DQEARRMGSRAIDIGHVLLGLIHQPDSNAGLILHAYNITVETVEVGLASQLDRTTSTGELKGITDDCKSMIIASVEAARSLRHRYVGSEHVLLGILISEPSLSCRLLRSAGMSPELVRTEIRAHYLTPRSIRAG